MNDIQACIAVFYADGDGNPSAQLTVTDRQSVLEHREDVARYLADLDAAIKQHGTKNLTVWGD